MTFDPETIVPPGAKIKVVGVGGGGGNAVNTMIRSKLEGVDFIASNTDVQALRFSLAPTKIQVGKELTKGLGAGADPDVGRDAALEDRHEIQKVLEGADMVFITAGMGGGTGTGGAAVVAQIARELGALTVAVVTKPFAFEGKRRRKQAELGVARLRECVDTLITIPNQRLLEVATPNMSMVDAFKMADDVLVNAVKGISDIINIPGTVNVDFADVKTVMSCMGQALMGIGAFSGEGRATKAAEQAIRSPLLEDIDIEGATGILLNITAGEDVTLMEVNEACSVVQEAAHEDANFIFGAVIDETLGDEMRVTVIATGFPVEDDEADAIQNLRGNGLINTGMPSRITSHLTTSFSGPLTQKSQPTKAPEPTRSSATVNSASTTQPNIMTSTRETFESPKSEAQPKPAVAPKVEVQAQAIESMAVEKKVQGAQLNNADDQRSGSAQENNDSHKLEPSVTAEPVFESPASFIRESNERFVSQSIVFERSNEEDRHVPVVDEVQELARMTLKEDSVDNSDTKPRIESEEAFKTTSEPDLDIRDLEATTSASKIFAMDLSGPLVEDLSGSENRPLRSSSEIINRSYSQSASSENNNHISNNSDLLHDEDDRLKEESQVEASATASEGFQQIEGATLASSKKGEFSKNPSQQELYENLFSDDLDDEDSLDLSEGASKDFEGAQSVDHAPLDEMFGDSDDDDDFSLTSDIDKRIDEALELAERLKPLAEQSFDNSSDDDDDLDVPAFLRNGMKDLPLG